VTYGRTITLHIRRDGTAISIFLSRDVLLISLTLRVFERLTFDVTFNLHDKGFAQNMVKCIHAHITDSLLTCHHIRSKVKIVVARSVSHDQA
jgi:hypothetical protein